ncbi:hypothetical protein LTS18_002944 [Coniosporium uncinatum]|uniref:Uncharacterized protein n=1 Tax=Coniosporium uncinatum TaxID=93489 RepID=A0ACC3DY62_9PEZI|nr:hypothetical protein LTS18_002944 [Coniosporium uncinatum]
MDGLRSPARRQRDNITYAYDVGYERGIQDTFNDILPPPYVDGPRTEEPRRWTREGVGIGVAAASRPERVRLRRFSGQPGGSFYDAAAAGPKGSAGSHAAEATFSTGQKSKSTWCDDRNEETDRWIIEKSLKSRIRDAHRRSANATAQIAEEEARQNEASLARLKERGRRAERIDARRRAEDEETARVQRQRAGTTAAASQRRLRLPAAAAAAAAAGAAPRPAPGPDYAGAYVPREGGRERGGGRGALSGAEQSTQSNFS